MTEKLAGKVALITGAARGQGRSHALRLAEQGANIIALDICSQIDSIPYPLATPEDLAETVSEVEARNRKIFAKQVDVRDRTALRAAINEATDSLGPIDIILANAGVAPQGVEGVPDETVFRDVIDINLIGLWNTVHAGVPSMLAAERGGSIVLTSSVQGLKGTGGDGSAAEEAYIASKHGVVGLMRAFAYWLSPHHIRVNSVHPTGVATPMVAGNAAMERWLENSVGGKDIIANLIPVDLVETRDVTDAVAWLVSDESRYVTGTCLPVDAGVLAR
ncbi:putative oxidoreductase (plasmid) [Rhodococcus opacus]|uniref:Putative oxidoreductase n=1 Tax=Rhodococcus opacus TaxID=37919 RepID=A0A1B1KHA2_RHOOP|nr:mycofactocin-coupled SDR family oxidoreductase [Rhodococcus opacus]ANS31987.1 putative oxidoreductase [Rhodococcus opacus]